MTPTTKLIEEKIDDLFEVINEDSPVETRDALRSALTSVALETVRGVRDIVGEEIEMGEDTHCKTCLQHIAAGECDCGGQNKERKRILSSLSTLEKELLGKV